MASDRTCSIDGCEKPNYGRGWCVKHYRRWQAHDDPLALLPVRTTEERFWAKVDQHGPDGFHFKTGANLGPCWLWTATQSGNGYGSFRFDRRLVPAHRFLYEMFVGPIPEGLEPDHLCRVRLCVRPTHLEPVTKRENILRGNAPSAKNATKTHCPVGHAYSSENTRVRPGGGRVCRACHRAHEAAYRSRKRAA